MTEIIAVMPDKGDREHTIHAGQATHYVARPTGADSSEALGTCPYCPTKTLRNDAGECMKCGALAPHVCEYPDGVIGQTRFIGERWTCYCGNRWWLVLDPKAGAMWTPKGSALDDAPRPNDATADFVRAVNEERIQTLSAEMKIILRENSGLRAALELAQRTDKASAATNPAGHGRLIAAAKHAARAWEDDPSSTETENAIRELALRAGSAVDAPSAIVDDLKTENVDLREALERRVDYACLRQEFPGQDCLCCDRRTAKAKEE